MNEAQIQGYINVVSVLVSAGIQVAGKVKELVALLSPGEDLTEEQINAIERAGIADSQRRAAEREAMGRPSQA